MTLESVNSSSASVKPLGPDEPRGFSRPTPDKGVFITRGRWDASARSIPVQGFGRLGELALVEPSIGALDNSPYLKSLSRRVQARRLRGGRPYPSQKLRVVVYPYCTTIYPEVRTVGQRTEAQSEAVRGSIRYFSRKSRMRMICLMRKMRTLPSVFATVTYDDSVLTETWDYSDRSGAYLTYQPPVNQADLARRVHADLHRLAAWVRSAYPSVGWVWRVEWKPRQSGSLAGWFVPHVHWLLWGLDDNQAKVFRRRFIASWLRCTGTVNPNAFKVSNQDKAFQKLDSSDKVFSYVSKYTAKEGEEMGFDTGRHWGCGGNVPKVGPVVLELDGSESAVLMRLVGRWLASKNIKFKTKRQREKMAYESLMRGRCFNVFLPEMEMTKFLEFCDEFGFDVPF